MTPRNTVITEKKKKNHHQAPNEHKPTRPHRKKSRDVKTKKKNPTKKAKKTPHPKINHPTLSLYIPANVYTLSIAILNVFLIVLQNYEQITSEYHNVREKQKKMKTKSRRTRQDEFKKTIYKV